jgi:energy-coupling factor transport system substrate-specific component
MVDEDELKPDNNPHSTKTPRIPQGGPAPVLNNKKASLWYVGPRQIIAAILGIVLYGLLSHINLIILIPTGTLDVFLPALLIPLFFGALYGPWVGLVVGGFGFLLGDYVANVWLHDLSWNNGFLFYSSALINFRDLLGWNGVPGYLANAMIGLIAGLTRISIRRYNNLQSLATVAVICAAGMIVGIAIVVYSAVWLYRSPYYALGEATSAFFNSTFPNLLFALVVLPLLLWVYELIVRGKK